MNLFQDHQKKGRFLAVLIVTGTLLSGLGLACSSTPHQDDQATLEGYYDWQAAGLTSNHMRHTIREILEFDNYKMVSLVNKEIDMTEPDENVFFGDVACVLGQTVMVQNQYGAREAALRELKSKVDQEDYSVIVKKAADQLLSIIKTNKNPADLASADMALTNLVVEIRSLHRPELKPTLEKIANANLTIDEGAANYAAEIVSQLVSPSSEARTALTAANVTAASL